MKDYRVVRPDGSELTLELKFVSDFLDKSLMVSKGLDGWFSVFEGTTKIDEGYVVDGSLMFGSVGQCPVGKTIDDGNYSGAFVDWKRMTKEEIMRLWKIRAFK